MSNVEFSEPADTAVEPLVQTEVPVNPYSLLEAVNGASAAARNGWVLFLGMMTYLLIAVAGVGHKDLLENARVELPILQVEIELTRFFLFAPLVLLFLHFGMLIQHVMLARKVVEFDAAVRPLEATRKRTHPLRLELHSYFYTQALAGPERSRLFGSFLQSMIWITFVAMPVLLVVYIQVVFLPYHDVWITWVHRITLITVILILIAIGVFLRRTEASFFSALWRTARHHPLNFLVTTILMALVVLFSFFVATVPGERLDLLAHSLPGYSVKQSAATAGAQERTIFAMAEQFIEGQLGSTGGRFAGLFHRNLMVTDQDLVKDEEDSLGEVSLNLRNRDLRYAVLDRSDMHRADLTGANLDGASLIGTDLRNSRLSCSDIDAVLTLEKTREDGCTHLRGTNLTRARLSGANLQLAYMTSAKLEAALLDGADLRGADLVNVDFSAAEMQAANLSGGADLVGANFLGALLQGADLSGAKLQVADFSSAALQGANFTFAQAQGASFQGAEMDAANLQFAKLQGADLSGATLKGADLSSAAIWMAVPPEPEDTLLADTARLKIEPIPDRDLTALMTAAMAVTDGEARERFEEAVKRLSNKTESQSWGTSDEFSAWRTLQERGSVEQREVFRTQLTNLLIDISCKVRWSDGSVATGVVNRALSPAFKGDIGTIYYRLTSKDCPASKSVPRSLFERLAAAVEKRDGRRLNQAAVDEN
ncbi:MAG: pentapeptide repeat-containing protein [Hyphomicrobiaceae bacterium]